MNTITNKIESLSFTEKLTCYAQLFKLKLTTFVVISAVFGYFIGVDTFVFSELLWLIIGGFFVTASSNSFNQIIEKEYDKLMKRTQNRPLPLNKISTKESFWVAMVLGFAGVSFLWLFLNPLSGILGVLAIFMYAAVYTPLKRISTISVFVGAFPGAIPPMLGWVAATGAFTLEAGILFIIQFAWQFPHFWAIAWKVNDDYKRAGFKMLPFGIKNKLTASIIVVSAFVLMATSFLPEFVGFTGRVTTVSLLLLSSLMVFPAIRLFQTLDDKYALRVMLMSYLYLILSLAVILIDKV